MALLKIIEENHWRIYIFEQYWPNANEINQIDNCFFLTNKLDTTLTMFGADH